MISWSFVRAFGKVNYFNVSYLVLIAVPILLELHHKATTASELLGKTLAFPATLRWLYAASLFYAVAIALYQYFCPSLVKSFASPEEYVAHSYDIFMRANPQHRLNIVLAHLDPAIDADVQSRIEELVAQRDAALGEERLRAQQELGVVLDTLHADAVQRFMVKEYESQNVRSTLVLWSCFALYVIGTVIMVVLLLRRSMHVFFLR